MAGEAGEADKDAGGGKAVLRENGMVEKKEQDKEDEASEEEDDEEEPRLKYASLTKHLTPVYRNGDATSAFLVAGDKMVSRESDLLNDIK